MEFGKNRVQFKKFKWQYYQTKISILTLIKTARRLAKYVAQVAEKELPGIENFVEYSFNAGQTLLFIIILMICSKAISGLGLTGKIPADLPNWLIIK